MADSQAVLPFTPNLSSDLGFGNIDVYLLEKRKGSEVAKFCFSG